MTLRLIALLLLTSVLACGPNAKPTAETPTAETTEPGVHKPTEAAPEASAVGVEPDSSARLKDSTAAPKLR